MSKEIPPKRQKAIYVGAPACFALELAVRQLNEAFGHNDSYGTYLVGSALERPDWRDIDVRMIMSDDGFRRLFPDAGPIAEGRWEFDPRWLIMTTAISAWLAKQSGLPIDFQFQPQSHANAKHKGRRNALGLHFAVEQTEDDE